MGHMQATVMKESSNTEKMVGPTHRGMFPPCCQRDRGGKKRRREKRRKRRKKERKRKRRKRKKRERRREAKVALFMTASLKTQL